MKVGGYVEFGSYLGARILWRVMEINDGKPLLWSEYILCAKCFDAAESGAKNLQTEASDIDLVVEFEHPLGFRFIEFTEYIESLLGKSVDILTPAGIQGIRIGRIASGIKESITYV